MTPALAGATSRVQKLLSQLMALPRASTANASPQGAGCGDWRMALPHAPTVNASESLT